MDMIFSRGIRICLENEHSLNDDFNISSSVSTSVLELAKMIWGKN